MNKTRIGFIVSSLVTFLGILLRLNAQRLAWPKDYMYSGARIDTSWAQQEVAIGQVGLVLACVGGLMLVAVFARWLFGSEMPKLDQAVTS